MQLATISQFYPELSAEEELELAKRLKHNNDIEAAHKLALHHVKLVIKVANRYKGYGLPFEDLVQEGFVGLLHGIKKFDYTRGVRLMAFAIYSIKERIGNYVVNNFRIVKIATTEAALKCFWNREIVNNSTDPLTELGVTAKQLEEFKTRFEAREAIIDDQILQLPSPTKTPEEHLLHNEEANRINKLKDAVKQLDARSQQIIRARYLTETPSTLAELAKELGVSGQRVAQIEQVAMKKLKTLCLEHN